MLLDKIQIAGPHQQDTAEPFPRQLQDETAVPTMRAMSRWFTFRRPGEMVYKLEENLRDAYKIMVMEDVCLATIRILEDYQVK